MACFMSATMMTIICGFERVLLHGTINHGEEVLDPKLRYTPTSYYGPDSGVGRAIRAVQERGPARLGVIGLGAVELST